MAGLLRSLAVVALALGITEFAAAGEMNQAAKLNQALGGSLDAGMIGEDGAGAWAGQGKVLTGVPLRPGRNEEFRRRVALAMAQSHLATSAH